MLDSTLRPIIDPPLQKFAALFKGGFITGNHITLIGFLFGLTACAAAFVQFYIIAFILTILNRFCDGLDGAVARARGEQSDFGGYLDILLDFIIYAGFPLSFALGLDTLSALQACAFILFSFICSGVSFLAYAIIAGARKMQTTAQGQKSFFYAKGLMEGTETILFLLLLCLIPQHFIILCCVFGTLCILTGLARIHMAYHVFK